MSADESVRADWNVGIWLLTSAATVSIMAVLTAHLAPAAADEGPAMLLLGCAPYASRPLGGRTVTVAAKHMT